MKGSQRLLSPVTQGNSFAGQGQALDAMTAALQPLPRTLALPRAIGDPLRGLGNECQSFAPGGQRLALGEAQPVPGRAGVQ